MGLEHQPGRRGQLLSQWFGKDIQAVPRIASSFVVKRDDVLLSGLDNASLYFSEDDDWRQMSFGLGGKFLNQANVFLEACPADWRKWNYQAEPVKTAALFRSEVEDTAPRAAIVEFPSGHGRVVLCNLESQVSSTRKAEVVGTTFPEISGIQTDKTVAQFGVHQFQWPADAGVGLRRLPVCRNQQSLLARECWRAGSRPARIWMDKNGPWPMQIQTVFSISEKDLVSGPMENAVAYAGSVDQIAEAVE